MHYRQVQPPPQGQFESGSGHFLTKSEFRCSPTTGRVYTVQVPVTGSQVCAPAVTQQTPPQAVFEWRCNPHTGELFRVQVGPPHVEQQVIHVAQHQQYPASQYQSNTPGEEGSQNFSKQLQKKVKVIVNLCEGGSTKKQNKLLEFAKKCPVGWAKKVTLESSAIYYFLKFLLNYL